MSGRVKGTGRKQAAFGQHSPTGRLQGHGASHALTRQNLNRAAAVHSRLFAGQAVVRAAAVPAVRRGRYAVSHQSEQVAGAAEEGCQRELPGAAGGSGGKGGGGARRSVGATAGREMQHTWPGGNALGLASWRRLQPPPAAANQVASRPLFVPCSPASLASASAPRPVDGRTPRTPSHLRGRPKAHAGL